MSNFRPQTVVFDGYIKGSKNSDPTGGFRQVVFVDVFSEIWCVGWCWSKLEKDIQTLENERLVHLKISLLWKSNSVWTKPSNSLGLPSRSFSGMVVRETPTSTSMGLLGRQSLGMARTPGAFHHSRIQYDGGFLGNTRKSPQGFLPNPPEESTVIFSDDDWGVRAITETKGMLYLKVPWIHSQFRWLDAQGHTS